MELLKGLDFFASQGLIFPKHLTNSLESGLERDYEAAWYGGSSELSPFKRQMMVRYMQNTMIPKLAGDPKKYAIGLAVGLAYVDSRTLSPDVRTKLGLNEMLPVPDESFEQPTLFAPSNLKEWRYLCKLSEHYLEQTLDPMNGQLPPEYEVHTPFTFLGCLQGKRSDLIAGLCTQTKEFANGSVFVKDVWYLLKGGLSGQLRKEITGHQPSTTAIDMPNCGGVWQPARLLNPHHSVVRYLT